MSNAPKKRPWFQLHLSTCVVLMFVAGGLMWANWINRGEFDSAMQGHCIRSYGFPGRWFGIVVFGDRTIDVVNPFSVVFNASFALLTTAATAAVLEVFIRRRERRRHE